MSLGDLVVKDQNVMTGTGARLYNVLAGTAINAGEPVYVLALGAASAYVQPAPTSFPDASAHLMVGVAATTGTQTSSAAGTVWVTPVSSALDYLITPDTAATWDTQAEYDALVGKRVLIDLTTGTYTLLVSDSVNNGCIIEPCNIADRPGIILFSFRNQVNVNN